VSLLEIIVLAVVQGTTEFLPISSSGHLVVLAALLSPDGTAAELEIAELNVVLHGGTLGSILVFYWLRIRQLLGQDRRIVGLIVIATVPAVLIGVPLKLFAEQSVLANPLLAGCLLIVTGLMLIWVSRLPRGTRPYQELTPRQAIWIGISQAAAILPGLSRSGTTIATGMRVGLSPTSAATFSFLLAIPAIAAACVFELGSSLSESGPSRETELATPADSPPTPPRTVQPTPKSFLAVGAIVSFVVGLGSLAWLVRWIEGNRLPYFAGWCIPLGIGVVLWQLSLR